MRLQLQVQQLEKGFTVLDWNRQLQRDAMEGIGIGFHWSDSCGVVSRELEELQRTFEFVIPAKAGIQYF